MPPKKAAGAGEAKDNGKFSWTAENERKLLLFTHGFNTISAVDFEKLLEHFPGTNLNGISIRYSRLRVEKRKLAEDNGFEGLGEERSKPGSSTAGTPKGKKRAAKDIGTDGEDLPVPATPAKKGKKGSAANVKEVKEEIDLDTELGGNVKAEGTEFKECM